jgi:hypothetical protein
VFAAIGVVLEGVDRCLDAVLQAELVRMLRMWGLDGQLADRRVPGDRAVAVTAGDQPESVISSDGATA